MGPPEANEPFAFYDPDGDNQGDPVVMAGGKGINNIDITLQDRK